MMTLPDLQEKEHVEVTKELLINALDDITLANGLAEYIDRWIALDNDTLRYGPREYLDEIHFHPQLEIIWMIAVCLFGNYGVHPSSGWIEDFDGFRQFCRDITQFWREDSKYEEE